MSTLDTLAFHNRAIARRVIETAKAQQAIIATAESCTGGLIGAALTDIAGSSSVFDRGFISYSNAAKIDLLGVPDQLIGDHGAVSEEVARAMAEGAITRSNANIAISVTGIAGPGGGTAEKPVGTIWFGIARSREQAIGVVHHFDDHGRDYIRQETVRTALELLDEQLKK